MNAPIVLQNEKTCNLIKKEPSISQILAKGKACNIALIGIGEISLTSTSYLCGAFSTGREKIEATKAVLKRGYIDIFMTSQDMAEELLK